VTTTLLGYAGTAERRTTSDPSITYDAEVFESVVRNAIPPYNAPMGLLGKYLNAAERATIEWRCAFHDRDPR
jgi:hypothetical protein